ncbi:MAG: hypothetical protein N6V41_01105, partial [Candidatus Portiera aleyrodidarum]|nr:hypothetical protein [Candidatus Portiera aleyrodidarum]
SSSSSSTIPSRLLEDLERLERLAQAAAANRRQQQQQQQQQQQNNSQSQSTVGGRSRDRKLIKTTATIPTNAKNNNMTPT